mgnify:CR=1 FL=1
MPLSRLMKYKTTVILINVGLCHLVELYTYFKSTYKPTLNGRTYTDFGF